MVNISLSDENIGANNIMKYSVDFLHAQCQNLPIKASVANVLQQLGLLRNTCKKTYRRCRSGRQMAEGSDYAHGVFQNNPVYLLSFVNKYALVKTKYSTETSGIIRSIDPVTESIIMEVRQGDKLTTKVIMGHCISELTSEEPPSAHELTNDPEPQELDPKHLEERKLAVLKWFSNNLLPVDDIDGVLQVHGGHLCIVPPYTHNDCISDNSIILGRIQQLLQNMPTTNQE